MTDNQHRSDEGACTVCGSTNLKIVVDIPAVPVHCNVLCTTRTAAIEALRGDIRLAFCHGCGHVFNLAFDPSRMGYASAYENSLHFSPQFRRYAEGLAAHLVERYDVRGKHVLEIGCGQGDFLRMICGMGGNRGTGFDPSYVPAGDGSATPDQISFVRDIYSDRYGQDPADLICCRHVLEHIRFPCDMLSDVRRAIGDRTDAVVFFEVPNALYTLKDLGIWDLIYEHCSYFSASSLARAFDLCGFAACDVSEAYGSQFLTIEAKPAYGSAVAPARSANEIAQIAGLAEGFAASYRRKIDRWRRGLERLLRHRRRTVIWGGGSKGVSFLNMLKVPDAIACVVDINPRKHGMYIPGTGQRIVAPDHLRENPPDTILAMNPIYQREIEREVHGLGLTANVICV